MNVLILRDGYSIWTYVFKSKRTSAYLILAVMRLLTLNKTLN